MARAKQPEEFVTSKARAGFRTFADDSWIGSTRAPSFVSAGRRGSKQNMKGLIRL
jgi:hypothetical protein